MHVGPQPKALTVRCQIGSPPNTANDDKLTAGLVCERQSSQNKQLPAATALTLHRRKAAHTVLQMMKNQFNSNETFLGFITLLILPKLELQQK